MYQPRHVLGAEAIVFNGCATAIQRTQTRLDRQKHEFRDTCTEYDTTNYDNNRDEPPTIQRLPDEVQQTSTLRADPRTTYHAREPPRRPHQHTQQRD